MLSEIELGQLPRADGSAACRAHGYKVVASVNGPVEVTRRDELPEEATVEVTIRPTAGVGGVRERHFEAILHKVLRHAIRVQDHPRALVQITLQVATLPESSTWSERSTQAASNIRALPALLNAATLALLSSTIPLDNVPVATFMTVDDQGSIVQVTSSDTVASAASMHVFAFSMDGRLLLAESEGSFDVQTWDRILEEARQYCLSSDAQSGQQGPATIKDRTRLADLIRGRLQAQAISTMG